MIDIFPCSDICYSEEPTWEKEKHDDFFIEEVDMEQNESNEPLKEE
jgi:hypothetical protein